LKKLFTVCICIFISFTLASCDNTQEAVNTITANEIISSDGTNFHEKVTYEQLIARIDNLENEIKSLKETMQNESNIMDNHGAIINALYNDVYNDNLLIGTKKEDGYLKEVHVKVPRGEKLSYDFYLLTGSENDGVQIFNCLIKPIRETSDNPQKIDIDPKEYDLYKLIMSNVKYDESSIMLIIIIDNKGNEYSQFVHSNIFASDI